MGICDSMAAALMQRNGVDACIVGADRVVANGDTANKIGTYGLSIIARHHGVPFFCCKSHYDLGHKEGHWGRDPNRRKTRQRASMLCWTTVGSRGYSRLESRVRRDASSFDHGYRHRAGSHSSKGWWWWML